MGDGAHDLSSGETHLQEGVEEDLFERLRRGQVAVAGSDLKGRLQALDRHCKRA